MWGGLAEALCTGPRALEIRLRVHYSGVSFLNVFVKTLKRIKRGSCPKRISQRNGQAAGEECGEEKTLWRWAIKETTKQMGGGDADKQ